MATRTVENYLKQLLILQQHCAATDGSGERIGVGKLASAMGVVPGTATTMVKTLADAGLVAYEPRGGVWLTHAGEQLALHVLRRHRLVELFLVKTLGLDWSEVHAEADELEHAISDKVIERIDVLLGRPSVDPHGDPIPSAKGTLDRTPLGSLEACVPGRCVRVARVLDQSSEFLQFVERCGLLPGVQACVESRDTLADAIVVKPEGKPVVTLGSAAAGKILVE